jgi:hypothetical protein
MTFSARYSRHYKQQQTKHGYYLVKPDGTRHFISSCVNVDALEKVADKVLSDADYWIDYLMPCVYDVNGQLAWANIDQVNKFI